MFVVFVCVGVMFFFRVCMLLNELCCEFSLNEFCVVFVRFVMFVFE